MAHLIVYEDVGAINVRGSALGERSSWGRGPLNLRYVRTPHWYWVACRRDLGPTDRQWLGSREWGGGALRLEAVQTGSRRGVEVCGLQPPWAQPRNVPDLVYAGLHDG